MSNTNKVVITEADERIKAFIETIRGTNAKDADIEKSLTVRLNSNSYSKVRGLANYSDASMNVIINELIYIGYKDLVNNLDNQERNDLNTECHAVFNDLYSGRGDE